MSQVNYTHELYFDQNFDFRAFGTAPVDLKTAAISNASILLKGNHLGSGDFEICGNSETPPDKPVIRGNFLTVEIMKLNRLGFKCEEIRKFHDIALPPEEYGYDTPEKAEKVQRLKDFFERSAIYDQVEGFINQRILAEIFPNIVIGEVSAPVCSAKEIFEQNVETNQHPLLAKSARDALEFDLAEHDKALSENPDLLANVPSLLRYYNIVTAKLRSAEVEQIRGLGFIVEPKIDVHAIISSRTNYDPQ